MDDQVSRQEFGTTSEYVQELIRHDRDRVQIRALLVEGLESPSAVAADEVYFYELTVCARKQSS